MLAPTTNPSDAQLSANRANAQHSTGPRTPEGKARSGQNAVKHGLFSRNVVGVRNPDPEREAEYVELLEDLLEDFEPGDRLETELIHRLATLMWRVAELQQGIQVNLAPEEPADLFEYEGVGTAETLGRMEARLSRELSRVMRDLTFLKRYKLDFADKVNAHRSRMAKRERAEFDAETERQIQEAFRVPPDDGYATAENTETEGEAAADPKRVPFDAEAEWRALQKRVANQKLKEKHAKQTQSAGAPEAPQPGDGSSDLT